MEQIGTLLFIDNYRTEQRAIGSAVHQFVNEFIVKSTACGIMPVCSEVKWLIGEMRTFLNSIPSPCKTSIYDTFPLSPCFAGRRRRGPSRFQDRGGGERGNKGKAPVTLGARAKVWATA
jgi:hypothetical protein